MALVSSTFACSCLYYDPDVLYDKQLCEWNPAFIGIVEITDDQEIEGYNRIYTVELIEVWKGPTNITKISTPSQSAACGQYASISQRLLITAVIRDGFLNVNLCSSLWLPSDSHLIPTLRSKSVNCRRISGIKKRKKKSFARTTG